MTDGRYDIGSYVYTYTRIWWSHGHPFEGSMTCRSSRNAHVILAGMLCCDALLGQAVQQQSTASSRGPMVGEPAQCAKKPTIKRCFFTVVSIVYSM